MIQISVIMPAYNVEKYISTAIDSIINNGFNRYELIIVDDNSTDRTLEIATEYESEYQNIKVIHTDGGCGCSYGRKIGLDFAKGKYIYFCDADDYLEKGTLSFVYEQAQNNDLDVIMFNGKFKNELKNQWGVSHNNQRIVLSKIPEKIISGKELLDIMIANKEWRYAVWLYFVKKDLILKNVDFFRGIVHEDPPYNYQLLNSAARVKFYNFCGYYYRLRENSLMSKKTSIVDIIGYSNAYNVIHNYNIENYLNDVTRIVFEDRMLEQLYETFCQLNTNSERKEAARIILASICIISEKNLESNVVKKLKKEVDKYEQIQQKLQVK